VRGHGTIIAEFFGPHAHPHGRSWWGQEAARKYPPFGAALELRSYAFVIACKWLICTCRFG
jgi:hypothetical protein